MPLVQFQPLVSQPSPEFWSALTALKLDKLRLDDSPLSIHASIDEGRQVISASTRTTGEAEGETIGVNGSVFLSGSSFDASFKRISSTTSYMKGVFRNFNTVEQFRSPQVKKDLFDSTTNDMIASFQDDDPQLNMFVGFAFADLKKYAYHYWFAFPALVSKPAWETNADFIPADEEDIGEFRRLLAQLNGQGNEISAFIVKGDRGGRVASTIGKARSFFADAPSHQCTVVFRDPSSSAHPGWPLRNVLYYLQVCHHISSVSVICLRQGQASRVGHLFTSGPIFPLPKPQVVGWERDKNGRLASKLANLGSILDPLKLAEQAVNLNLKLMRWRILPDLELDKVAATRCLLLGAGTLGCYVARILMGWGIKTITFVDSARVSFSNPVRQPLFTFDDCLHGGKLKAQCAADRLKEVFPCADSSSHSFQIPMPGHPVGSDSEDITAANITKLESLIQQHDAIFLLMDSRESRWLPTVLAANEGKIVINAALGFDSYLVMRHGAAPSGGRYKRLGCYFCNDIVAPKDSLTDRTLDQMCTVTRPGVAPIAAASAVELLVSIVQHPLGINAPAEKSNNLRNSCALGPVPHQLRGTLGQWNTVMVEGSAYDRCTGCSDKVVNAYREHGFGFLRRAFNETGFLENLTGLDVLYAEGEAILDSVNWDDSDEEF